MSVILAELSNPGDIIPDATDNVVSEKIKGFLLDPLSLVVMNYFTIKTNNED